MLIMSYMGDQVWLITSRQTDPDLQMQLISISIHLWMITCPAEHSQLVDVWVKDAVHEANARALIRVLIGQFHVNFPMPASEGSWRFWSARGHWSLRMGESF